jgi:hypothetical protein
MNRFPKLTIALALIIAPAMLMAAAEAPRKVTAPQSDQHFEVTELGYVEAQDAFVKQDEGTYAFVVYTRLAKDGGKKELVIRSNLVTGTSFTPEKGNKMAADLERQGKSMRTWGSPFTASGPEDKRVIEYRFHQKDGKPTGVEIYAVTRDAEHKATPAKSPLVTWPFPVEAPPAEPEDAE